MALSAPAAQRLWSGAGANDNWSTSGNWSALPVAGDDAIFGDADATGVLGSGGTANNIVDAGFTAAIRALWYTNSAGGSHFTRIEAPRLTISGTTATNVLQVGTGADNGLDFQLINAIAGTSLVISNNNGTFQVRQTAVSASAGQHRAILDMTGLNSFSGTVSNFAIARTTESTNVLNTPQGSVYLAKTNAVTTTGNFVIGESVNNPGTGAAEVWLGQENTFNVAGLFRTGYRKSSATMLFQTNLSNPTLKVRGSGTNRVSTWSIADNGSGSTGTSHSATNDFTGGRLDALVDTMYVARSYTGDNLTGNGTSRGTLTLDAGLLDVNTLEVGQQPAINSSGNALGVINVNGTAEVRVNKSLRMALTQGSATPSGTINVSGGTLKVASDIVDGGGTTTLNLTNGVVDLQPAGDPAPGVLAVDNLNWESGTLTNLGGLYSSEVYVGTPTAVLSFGSNAVISAGGKGVCGTMNVNGGGEFSLQDQSRWQVDLYDSGGASDIIYLSSMAPKLSGTVQVEITAASPSLPNNTYTLMNFPAGTLVGSAANLAIAGPLKDSRHTFAFSTSSGYSVDVTVDGADFQSLTWSGDGVANLWQVKGAANWNSQTEKFYSLDSVTLDDTGSAAAPIQLDGALYASAVTMNNNSKSYIFGGSGKITGIGGITLQGTGSLTVLTTNDNSGPTTISAGQLQVGDGVTADGALGPGAIASEGSLVFAPVSTQLVANAISGGGSLTKTGPGMTVLSGANSYSGVTVVTQGVLQVRTGLGLGTTAGATYVTNGATLDIADQNLGLEPILVSGAGVSNMGALFDSNSSGANQQAFRDVTLLGDTTFGGMGRWEIRGSATTDPGFRGNGYKLTKVGPGFVAIIASGFWNTGLGEIDIQQATLSFEQPCSLGVPTATMNIRSNANLQIYDNRFTNTLAKNVIMENTAQITATGPAAGSGTNVFGGTLNLNGTNRLNTSQSSAFLVPGIIQGSGALNKTGNGRLYLSAANSYTGATIVSSGLLMLQPTASIQSSPIIALATGTLDVSQIAGGFTLASGQTLQGAGNVNGSVTVPGTGFLNPGAPIGTMTFSNNLSLNGMATFELNKTSAATNDFVVVLGTLSYGGKLAITNAGPMLSVGDKFTLFSKPGTGSFSSIEYPTGYTFTNNLAVDGSITVTEVLLPSTPTNLTYQVSGQTLTISWPASYLGWRLQVQANPNTIGLSNNWQTVVGSEAMTGTNITMDPAGPAVFYRLAYPNP